MEFAEWVVSGLDQLRSGQLPAGSGLYEAVAAGLGGDPALDAFMNGGDDAARQTLVQAIAQAAAQNPAFEQQVRQAAASAQGAPDAQAAGVAAGTGAAAAQPPFFKTTNGLLVLVAAAVVVVGGGIGLAVGLSGDGGSGGGALSGAVKGTWQCTGFDGESGSVTIGDGTWSAGSAKGTWKQSGSKVTITNQDHAGDDLLLTGAPSGVGPVDATLGPAKAKPGETIHIKGTVSGRKLQLTAQAPGGGSDATASITCTK
jgi:hypothetical protein